VYYILVLWALWLPSKEKIGDLGNIVDFAGAIMIHFMGLLCVFAGLNGK
jgi:ammonia channel protein AmtB